MRETHDRTFSYWWHRGRNIQINSTGTGIYQINSTGTRIYQIILLLLHDLSISYFSIRNLEHRQRKQYLYMSQLSDAMILAYIVIAVTVILYIHKQNSDAMILVNYH